MALFEIKMPKLGESITEGTIMSWSVKVGDTINEDDVLFEVSTAKVSAEIPSPVAGKIMEILFNVDDVVPVGTVVARVQIEGEGDDEAPASTPTEEPKAETPAAPSSTTAPASVAPAPAVTTNVSKGDADRWYSPIVLQLAKAANLPQEELDSIPGTGYLGRLSKKDIERYLEHKKNGTTASAPAPAAPQPASQAKQPAAPSQPLVAASATGEDQVIEMDRVRRIIADRMVDSKKISPHVTTVMEVDVTRLVRWRARNKDEFKKREGISLTYMPAIAEATAKALAQFPYVNSSVDGYNIILKKHINMGIAVSLDDGNLVVPVIHDADKLNINGLASSIDTLAKKARTNKLAMNEMQGGTFTITNYGSFKSLFATPIINQPEVAILGVGYIEKKPAVIETPEGDTIAIRHKLYLSLSHDHRVVDGSLGGQFLKYIADYLENWNG